MKLTPSFRVTGHAVVVCLIAFLLALIAVYFDSVLLHVVAIVVMLVGLAAGIWGVFALSNNQLPQPF